MGMVALQEYNASSIYVHSASVDENKCIAKLAIYSSVIMWASGGIISEL